ncbi:MAG: hypothetical protein JW829_03920, partial [Pirellulales bacterium]|nr:hypothetical protein [Pirellulales bacterium]
MGIPSSQSAKDGRQCSFRPNWGATLRWILLLWIMGSTITGCGGCGGCTNWSSPQGKKQREEARKKTAEALKKKKEKKPLEISQLAVEPHDEILLPMMKRGHWCVADQSMIANFESFVGDLELKIVDKEGAPIALDRTPFRMPSTRPVSLSKGRAKNIKTTFFAPTRGDTPSVATLLNQHGSMGLDTQSRVKANLMPPYQYHFVVLAKNPARYTYVKTLDVISMPNGGLEESVAATDGSYLGDNDVHYRVVLPNLEKHVPLPDHCLLWSTIAYVLWDDISPDRLSLDQRQAMVDWLHWGGQLIVSGPGSLDLLKNSFLNLYLPAEDGGATQIEQAAIDDLGAQWRAKNTSLAGGLLKASQPWSGIRLKLRPESKFV